MARRPKKKGRPSLLEGFRSIHEQRSDISTPPPEEAPPKGGPPPLENPSANLPGGHRPQVPQGSQVAPLRQPMSPITPHYVMENSSRVRQATAGAPAEQPAEAEPERKRPAVTRRAVIVDRESALVEMSQSTMVLVVMLAALVSIGAFLGGAAVGSRTGLFGGAGPATAQPGPDGTQDAGNGSNPQQAGFDTPDHGGAATQNKHWVGVTQFKEIAEPQARQAVAVLEDRGFDKIGRKLIGGKWVILAGPYTTKEDAEAALDRFHAVPYSVTIKFGKSNLHGATILTDRSSNDNR